jgi:putative iron-dependent peroxidase
VPQPGIFAQGTTAHYFLEFDFLPAHAPEAVLECVSRLRQPAVSAGAVNVVVAFGPALWRSIAPDHVPESLHEFTEISGPGGRRAPATQHDLWLWISGSSTDVVFEHARAAARTLRGLAELRSEQPCFVNRDSRDLTGFIDGTANPPPELAPQVALVAEGRPGEGGSHVLAQKWVHDLDRFDELSVPDQQRVFGRTKADSTELEGSEKPADSHIARVDIRDASGADVPIFRRSVPFGTVSESGLYFVAFSADPLRYDRMLARMFGTDSDGLADRLTGFTRPVGGGYYFAPSLTALAGLSP